MVDEWWFIGVALACGGVRGVSMWCMKVKTTQLQDLVDVLVRLRNYPRGANYRARFADADVDVPLAVRNVVRAIELLTRRGEVSVGDVANQLAIEASSAS